jgi:protein-L-isoaspartate O-methyltransferase
MTALSSQCSTRERERGADAVAFTRLQERTYDRIHVGACCPTPRLQSLIDLLKPGGILVTPNEDSLVKITKSPDGESTSIDKLASVRYGGKIQRLRQLLRRPHVCDAGT